MMLRNLMLMLFTMIGFISCCSQEYYYYPYGRVHYVGYYSHIAPVCVRVNSVPNGYTQPTVKQEYITNNNVYNVYTNTQNETSCDEEINVTMGYSDMWKQTVWFHEDKYLLNTEYNKIALTNVADFMHNYSDCEIVIYGYASKRHGSYSYNKNLAAKRCVSVKAYLTSHGIDKHRITMIVKGTDNPEYYQDNWNQCVIIKCK